MMPSLGGSGFNAEVGESNGEDRGRSAQPGTQGNDDSDNLNDYMYQGLAQYSGGLDGTFWHKLKCNKNDANFAF